MLRNEIFKAFVVTGVVWALNTVDQQMKIKRYGKEGLKEMEMDEFKAWKNERARKERVKESILDRYF